MTLKSQYGKKIGVSMKNSIRQQEDEDLISKNKQVLLALISESKGKIKSYGRIRIATYKLKGYGLHDYKFEGRCPISYGDPKFKEDLNTLGVYVGYGSYVDKNDRPHRLYELNELGEWYGKQFANTIKKNNKIGYERIQEIGKLLSDPICTIDELNKISDKEQMKS